MSWMPEPEPTPLRLRLGPRSEVPVRPAFDDADHFDIAEDIEAPIDQPERVDTSDATPTESAVAPVETKDPLRAAASEELQRAVEQTALRVERWMEDQRRRLGVGIDAMVASLKEQRDAELARIEVWKDGERGRAGRKLGQVKGQLHEELLLDIVALSAPP